MSTHNIGFYEDLNYHQISSNTHLISSAECRNNCVYAYTDSNIIR